MGSDSTQPALVFYLDAPMQAWGASSRFRHRKTETFPTKSGVLGLLAAALGIDKHAPDEDAKIAPLAELKFSVFRIASADRTKRHPTLRLEDFHTVGGGYDSSDPREVLHISRKASGGPSTTVITHRTYLTDARFLAVLEGDAALLERCAAALENPKWGVWFGRKCCLPASPLAPTLGSSRKVALDQWMQYFAGASQTTEGEQQAHEPGSRFQNDEPVSYGTRTFQSRPVSRTGISI